MIKTCLHSHAVCCVIMHSRVPSLPGRTVQTPARALSVVFAHMDLTQGRSKMGKKLKRCHCHSANFGPVVRTHEYLSKFRRAVSHTRPTSVLTSRTISHNRRSGEGKSSRRKKNPLPYFLRRRRRDDRAHGCPLGSWVGRGLAVGREGDRRSIFEH